MDHETNPPPTQRRWVVAAAVALLAIGAAVLAWPDGPADNVDTTAVAPPDETTTTVPESTTSTTSTTTTPPTSTSTTSTSTTSTSSESGVRGTVTAGPTCPVERPDEPCPPQPLAVHIRAIGADGTTAAATDSAGDGRYAMALPAGQYTLRVDTGGTFPTCPDTEVTVEAGSLAVADISCDTGIR